MLTTLFSAQTKAKRLQPRLGGQSTSDGAKSKVKRLKQQNDSHKQQIDDKHTSFTSVSNVDDFHS